jgi:tRNA(Ile)-lysidine synthase
MKNASARKIKLPGRFIVWREYENLIFERYEKEAACSEELRRNVTLEFPGEKQFGQYLIEATILECETKYLALSFIVKMPYGTGDSVTLIERFDLDKIKPPLIVRNRQDGDKFWPLGLKAEKKVGKFLTATKLPQQLRTNVLIVADSEKIIWVWPIRISEKAKITDETRKILQLHITDTKLKCPKL